MIPLYPDFKKLEVIDKEDVKKITDTYPPYSDFNFTSLLCWDTEESVELSMLNNNLVVKFIDYIDKTIFFSFIGNHIVDGTALTLLENTKILGIEPVLKLVPEIVIQALKHSEKFEIKMDRDSFDYIIDAEGLNAMSGSKYKWKRKNINHLKNEYENKITVIYDFILKDKFEDILQTFEMWAQVSGKKETDIAGERVALKRLLENSEYLTLETLGIYIDDKMVAFAVYEILNQENSIGHFEKALRNYVGLFEFTKHTMAKNLYKKGVKKINIEQDMGIPGLREAKLGAHPIEFLKKYTVSLKK